MPSLDDLRARGAEPEDEAALGQGVDRQSRPDVVTLFGSDDLIGGGADSIRRAILQNGIQYSEDSMTGYYNGVVPLLVKPGVSVPIFHTDRDQESVEHVYMKDAVQLRPDLSAGLPPEDIAELERWIEAYMQGD